MQTEEDQPEEPEEGRRDHIVFDYGLLPPHVNAKRVYQEMREAHFYRNKLIEIERTRREAVRGVLSRNSDVFVLETQVKELAEKLEAARTEIKKARAISRKRSDSVEQRAAVKQIADSLREMRVKARAARDAAAADPEIMTQRAEINARAEAAIVLERKNKGAYWGTTNLQETAMRASRAAVAPPKFIRWQGEGRVGVQTQGGLDVENVVGGKDLRLQIVPSAPRVIYGVMGGRVWVKDKPPRATVSQGKSYVLRLRVGSDGRKPIFAEWVMVMARPLPEKGIVRSAVVSKYRRGTSWDWRLDITVDVTKCDKKKSPADGACALNLGFARRPGGALRSGYVVGDDGFELEILAEKSDRMRGKPPDVTWTERGLDKANAMRGQRDRDFDAAKVAFLAWKEAQKDLPEWFLEETATLATWRSPGRLASLVHKWQQGWFDGGDTGYDLLEKWRLRDLHLERYETGMRTSVLRDRKEGYRLIASYLAKRYHTLIIDDTDLRKFQRSPKTEDERTDRDAVKRQQVVAAPSELRLAMINAFGPERLIKLSAVRRTRLHSKCGFLNEASDEAREVRCAGCGEIYDQDANFDLNLLQEFAASRSDLEAARKAKLDKVSIPRFRAKRNKGKGKASA